MVVHSRLVGGTRVRPAEQMEAGELLYAARAQDLPGPRYPLSPTEPRRDAETRHFQDKGLAEARAHCSQRDITYCQRSSGISPLHRILVLPIPTVVLAEFCSILSSLVMSRLAKHCQIQQIFMVFKS